MKADITSEPDLDELVDDWQVGPDSGEQDTRSGEPKIRSVSEIASIREYAAQKIEYVIDGVLAVGTVAAITGESGGGKSTVATAMGGSVAEGRPFAGLPTQRRPVLILDRENPLCVVSERFDRLGIQDGLDFKVWGGWCLEEAPVPCSLIVLQWVAACVVKPLIVVDSLVSFHDGDENDATETRAYMQGFRRLADMGAPVIVLHHSGKGESSKEYRGSSDIKASIDVGYHLANLGEPSQLGILRMKAFKARFSVRPELILRYENGRFRMDERGTVRTNQELLQEILIENAGIQGKAFEEMAAKKGVTRTKARDFLASGIISGSIRAEKGSHNTRFHTWVEGDSETL